MSKDSCAKYHQTNKEKKSLVKSIKFLSKKKNQKAKYVRGQYKNP